MKDGKFDLRTFLDNIELYLATLFFIILTIMLTLQVISRYVLQNSFTWMEEFATIMFVGMIYLGVSSAVTKRKHLRIDFFFLQGALRLCTGIRYESWISYQPTLNAFLKSSSLHSFGISLVLPFSFLYPDAVSPISLR